ncbi:MAG: hypothetical protein QOJ11_1440 [Frankiales bacterium]|jgi:hypothetical protein|nr:hypothetical protein [Frankiales bacterium]
MATPGLMSEVVLIAASQRRLGRLRVAVSSVLVSLGSGPVCARRARVAEVADNHHRVAAVGRRAVGVAQLVMQPFGRCLVTVSLTEDR